MKQEQIQRIENYTNAVFCIALTTYLSISGFQKNLSTKISHNYLMIHSKLNKNINNH